MTTEIIDGPDPFDLAAWRAHLTDLETAARAGKGRTEAIASAKAHIDALQNPRPVDMEAAQTHFTVLQAFAAKT